MKSCMKKGVAALLVMLVPVFAFMQPRALEATGFPVVDVANLARGWAEFVQRVSELGYDIEQIIQAYYSWLEQRSIDLRMLRNNEAWARDQLGFVLGELAALGIGVNGEVLELLEDLHRLVSSYEDAVVFADREVGALLQERYPGFSLSVEPESWIEREERHHSTTMDSLAGLLDLVGASVDASVVLAQERVDTERALLSAEGNKQALQLVGSQLTNLGDVLEMLVQLGAAETNATAIGIANRSLDGENRAAGLLWITSGREDVVPLEGADWRDGIP